MQKIILNGTISISDTSSILNHMNYIITSLIDQKETSITNILDTIFKSTNTIDKMVKVSGTIYNSNHKFGGFGKLLFGKQDYKAVVDEYFVKDFPLCRQFLELAENNKNIELIIEDYADSIGDFITGTSEETKNDSKSKES